MGDETAVVIWEQVSQQGVPQTASEKENDLRLVVPETVMD